MPIGVYPREHILSRFWRRVDKSKGPMKCWFWLGASHSAGYGVFPLSHKKNIGAHRFSLQLHIGRNLERWEMACHHCDNPICVNPKHLFVGDASLNGQDASRKKRLCHGSRHHAKKHPMKGSGHGMSKLDEVKVSEIKKLLNQKTSSQVSIAHRFNVTPKTINYIALGKTWRHVCE